jgi:hypothetical protein
MRKKKILVELLEEFARKTGIPPPRVNIIEI